VALVGPLWYPVSADPSAPFHFEIETGPLTKKTYERDLKIETLPECPTLHITSELIWQDTILQTQSFLPILPGEETKLSLILRTDLTQGTERTLRISPTDPFQIKLTIFDGKFVWTTQIGPFRLVSRVKAKEAQRKIKKEFKVFSFHKQAVSHTSSDPHSRVAVKRKREDPPEEDTSSKRRKISDQGSFEASGGEKLDLIFAKLDMLEQLQRQVLATLPSSTTQVLSPEEKIIDSSPPSSLAETPQTLEQDMFDMPVELVSDIDWGTDVFY